MAEKIASFTCGAWHTAPGAGALVHHAVSGEPLYEVSSDGLDFQAMTAWARAKGGPALRKMTFHQRARMLKAVARYLLERKESFYEISKATGATRKDSWIDIEGGIGTLFTYASKGRRELPDEPFHVDGPIEMLGANRTFAGQHICVPLEGVAVHINAFNFPCWGMLEKLGPTFLAGMPAIVKPASVSCYVTRAVVAAILESELLPPGSLQLICGGTGDLLEHLTCQDVVTFTGSKDTGTRLKQHQVVLEHSVRFNLEADSLNYSILGPDAHPKTAEFELFVREVAREMTVKAGQKCTVIRRVLVPARYESDVIAAVQSALAKIPLGDPSDDSVRMGPLVSREHAADVRSQVARLLASCSVVVGSLEQFPVRAKHPEQGAFFPPLLLRCGLPLQANEAHEVEAFGPVSTLLPYSSIEEAIELARRGGGSLCGSVFTADDQVARELCLGTAPFHGRLLLVNEQCAGESTGHGSPLPHLVHGGPGRAGGGEELGGIRSVFHYMQRTAVQGSPQRLSVICNRWLSGAETKHDQVHPFRKYFDELQIGETWVTHRRTVTEADIVAFAGLSGDYFYAHMDDGAARASIFKNRVAHGYFLVSAAAGLFVDPAPGPVLANYGLENLRFLKPVYIGDTIHVRLTCAQKTARDLDPMPDGGPQGIVAWDVSIYNQLEEEVAHYTVLTLVARKLDAAVTSE
ncbi:MAG: phenylacetic acid degradation bifunctional protein PaaZ [Bdellovibrionales bacterium]|nr:phenylacetic acid degradation bifunctional protein PaaZ [Bdellovibrionales bacterium]